MSLLPDCEICGTCGCDPCKCQLPGPTVFAPQNSDQIVDPVPSDELAEEDDSEGSSSTSTSTSEQDMSCQGPLAADFTAPAINGAGTITITGAGTFAAAGGFIWIPGIGTLLVNSAATDTLAVTNRDIPAGTVINTGTMAWFSPPVGTLAGLCVGPGCGCAEDPPDQECIDSLFGCVAGVPVGMLLSNFQQLTTPIWFLPGGSGVSVYDKTGAAVVEVTNGEFGGFTAPEGATHAMVQVDCGLPNGPAGPLGVHVGGREYLTFSTIFSGDNESGQQTAWAKITAGKISYKITDSSKFGAFGGVGAAGFVRLRIIGYAALKEL